MKTIMMLAALAFAYPALAADEKDSGQAQKLATAYKVPQADVQALRDKGMGWGEVDHALAISQKSGQPVSEIAALRESGMGWGEIAKKYDVKLGEIKGRGHDKRAERAPKGERGPRREPKAERGSRGGGPKR